MIKIKVNYVEINNNNNNNNNNMEINKKLKEI
jgi:hypothetical protein